MIERHLTKDLGEAGNRAFKEELSKAVLLPARNIKISMGLATTGQVATLLTIEGCFGSAKFSFMNDDMASTIKELSEFCQDILDTVKAVAKEQGK